MFFKKLTFSKVRTFQKRVFFSKAQAFFQKRVLFFKSASFFFKSAYFFQNLAIFKILRFSKTTKKKRGYPLPHIMELIINKVRSITLPPKTDFEIDRTIPFKPQKESYVFLVEQNSTLVKNGLSNNTKYKKWVGT